MTDATSKMTPPVTSQALPGIACIQLGMLLFVGQDLLMKSLLNEYTVWMLILIRSIVAVVVLTPVIVILGPPHRIFTQLWPVHLLRGVLFSFGFTLYYAAFPFMGLVEITTIFFASPMFTAIFAAIFLGETIGIHRSAALVAGFAGVVVAMQPGGSAFNWIALCPLICAMTYAISQVLARWIGDRESTMTLGLYTLAFAGLTIVPMAWALNTVLDLGMTYPHLAWSWPVPDMDGAFWLLVLGSNGMIAIMLLWRAYQIAPASVIAPFDYSYLPWAALFSYLLWQEVPGPHTLIGLLLIVGSGLYIGVREMKQTRRAYEPAPTAEAVVAPGAPIGGPKQLKRETFETARIAPMF